MGWILNVNDATELLKKANDVREVLCNVPAQLERRKILLLAKLLSLDGEPSSFERTIFLTALSQRAVMHAAAAFPRRFGEDEIAMAMLRAVNWDRAKEILALQEPEFAQAVESVCAKYHHEMSWAEQQLARTAPQPQERRAYV